MEKNCDNCPHPGACCKKLTLFDDGQPLTYWEKGAQHYIAADMEKRQLPFIPLLPVPTERVYLSEEGHKYIQPAFRCPKLGEDGRCTDYENRPQLCRDYQPLDDGLCCHHPDWDETTLKAN